MRLADDSFDLKLGSNTFVLRPTLRAAFHLDRTYEGFQNLSIGIAEGSLTTATDLITATVTDQSRWAAYALASDGTIVRDLMNARDQLLEFLLILTGATVKNDKPQTGKPTSFLEFHTRLFEIGTGWLSWSPDITWSSTPAEILAAHKGRTDMLKAIFGGGDKQERDESIGSLKDRLNALGDTSVHMINEVP